MISMDTPKKKRRGRPSGKHTTVRKPIQIPVEWLKVGHELAKRNEKPLVWYVIKRWAEEAKSLGIDIPSLPWERD